VIVDEPRIEYIYENLIIDDVVVVDVNEEEKRAILNIEWLYQDEDIEYIQYGYDYIVGVVG
jgi:ribosomal silencing factor RsfS